MYKIKRMNIFYYQKGKEASFVLPKDKQYKFYYNNVEEKVKHGSRIEPSH